MCNLWTRIDKFHSHNKRLLSLNSSPWFTVWPIVYDWALLVLISFLAVSFSLCSAIWLSRVLRPTPSLFSSTPHPSCGCRVRVTATLSQSVCLSGRGTPTGCWCSQHWLMVGWRWGWQRARSQSTWMWRKWRTYVLTSHQVSLKSV